MQRRVKLDILLRRVDPDIICLTETWFDSNINDCEVFLNSKYQKQKGTDGQIGTHGGALIAQKSKLVLEEVKTIDTTESWVSTCVYEFRDIMVTLITIYNPPVNSSYRNEYSILFGTIDSPIGQFDQYVAEKGKDKKRTV